MPLIPTIGLEVHCQLQTRSKLFCACPVSHGAAPNTSVCPVCLGYPGALPVLNDRAVQLAIRAGLALGCTIHTDSEFSRKHYFYPDLPKGYQISQFDRPICTAGQIHIDLNGVRSVHALERIHIEEDAGKMRHGDSVSRLDWNRSGTPLVEIVGQPDLHSPEAAGAWMRMLHRVVVKAGVCTGDMEKGHFRCDANVSVAPEGGPLGRRVELKNINSFRFVERAIRFEVDRQVALIAKGGVVQQSTRSWTGSETVLLRSKEGAADYRYFPEPDLPEVCLDGEIVAAERERLAGIPLDVFLLTEDDARLSAFLQTHEIRKQDAITLLAQAEARHLFEEAVGARGQPQAMANWILGPVQGHRNTESSEDRLTGAQLACLESLVEEGTINRSTARGLLGELMATGGDPAALVAERELNQVSDASEIREVISQVLTREVDAVLRYNQGQKRVIGFLIGEVMRTFGGRANPSEVRKLLADALNEAVDGVVSSGSTESDH